MSEVMKRVDQVGLLNQIVRSILDKIESDVMDIDLLIQQNKFSEISFAYAKINGIRAALSIVEREIESLMLEADVISNEPRRVDPDTVKSELQGEIDRIDYLLKDSAFAGETTMYITGHESNDRSTTGLLHRRSAIEFAIRLIDGQN